jgi:hypothetical protein
LALPFWTAVNVKASFSGTETIHAAAGAAGGTSIVPVLALAVSGVYSQAYLGTQSARFPPRALSRSRRQTA